MFSCRVPLIVFTITFTARSLTLSILPRPLALDSSRGSWIYPLNTTNPAVQPPDPFIWNQDGFTCTPEIHRLRQYSPSFFNEFTECVLFAQRDIQDVMATKGEDALIDHKHWNIGKMHFIIKPMDGAGMTWKMMWDVTVGWLVLAGMYDWVGTCHFLVWRGKVKEGEVGHGFLVRDDRLEKAAWLSA